MTEREFTDELACALGDAIDGAQAVAFDRAGVLTSNHGCVVRLPDGSEYQVTVVRSRRPSPREEER